MKSSTTSGHSINKPIMSLPTDQAAIRKTLAHFCYTGNLLLFRAKRACWKSEALAQTTKLLRQVQQVRNGRPFATIILSMVGKHYRLTKDMKEAAEALDMGLADSVVSQRQVYADAPGQKAVVWKLGARGRNAGKEMKELFKEILPFACKRIATKSRTAKTTTSDVTIPEIQYV